MKFLELLWRLIRPGENRAQSLHDETMGLLELYRSERADDKQALKEHSEEIDALRRRQNETESALRLAEDSAIVCKKRCEALELKAQECEQDRATLRSDVTELRRRVQQLSSELDRP